MKKSIFIFFLLMIFCITGMCYAGVTINSERDKVNFYENIIYGNKSALKNLTVNSASEYEGHLLWESQYIVGEVPSVSTDYSFSAFGIAEEEAPREYYGVDIQSNFEYGVDTYSDITKLEGMLLAYRELFDSVAPGERGDRTVYYKDYYEFYPVNVTVNLPGTDVGGWVLDSDTEESKIDFFEEIFKIPVLEDSKVQISVSKRQNGTLESFGSGEEGDSFGFSTYSAYTEDASYFTFSTHTRQGNVTDTSYISKGYGIYALPYYSDEKGAVHLEADRFEMVYPLDSRVKVVDLQTNIEKTRLHLFTVEDNLCIITIIDIETMETWQRIELSEADGIQEVFLYEDFIVVWLWDNRLALVSISEEGTYELCFVTEATDKDNMLYFLNADAVMDWNGETLAVCGTLMRKYTNSYSGRRCGFYLAAYDCSGMVYYGEYNSSLSTESFMTGNYYCEPSGYMPLKIEFR